MKGKRAGWPRTAAVLVLAPMAAADTTLGRWCDRWGSAYKSHRIVTLTLRDDGSLVLVSKFVTGNWLRQEIRELPNGIFEKIGNPYKEKVRIIPSDGHLQLLDENGLIRVATRLENTPRPGEC